MERKGGPLVDVSSPADRRNKRCLKLSSLGLQVVRPRCQPVGVRVKSLEVSVSAAHSGWFPMGSYASVVHAEPVMRNKMDFRWCQTLSDVARIVMLIRE